MKKSLTKMKPGEQSTIVNHYSQGIIRQRLLALGLLSGTKIEFVRYAPMGDPLEFRIGLTNIVLRATEAKTIIVEI